MSIKHTSVVLAALLTVYAGTSFAAQIRASGAAFGQSQTEVEPDPPQTPFERSIVDVQDGGVIDGVSYVYSASSDIGLGELKAFGSLNNPTADRFVEIEVGVLSANAFLEDTITIMSTSTDDYDVTYEFHVDGVTDFGGGAGFAGASLSTGAFASENASFNTSASQVIDETLSVTRTYNGTIDQRLVLSLFLVLTEVDVFASISADLANTASLNIILPAGVTITDSDSGTFLEAIKPVPIPAALPLMCVLFAGLAVYRERRRN